jgi:hypothetical protein
VTKNYIFGYLNGKLSGFNLNCTELRLFSFGVFLVFNQNKKIIVLEAFISKLSNTVIIFIKYEDI